MVLKQKYTNQFTKEQFKRLQCSYDIIRNQNKQWQPLIQGTDAPALINQKKILKNNPQNRPTLKNTEMYDTITGSFKVDFQQIREDKRR